MFRRYFSNHTGFTLIEIISILTMVSVISLILLSSGFPGISELGREVDIAKAQLRYAQSMALSNDIYPWGITFSSDSYRLFKIDNTISPPQEIPMILPGENSPTHTLPPGISIIPVTITFDKKGSAASSDQTVQFSDSTQITTIKITKNTGFIP